MNDDHLRIGDAEREQATAALGEHYAQGRLTAEEHAERLDRIWAARTRADLRPVFWDLPGGGPVSWSGSGPVARGFGGRRRVPIPVLVVLAVLVVLSVVTHLPLIVAGLVLWLFLTHRRSWGRRSSAPGGRWMR